MASKIIHNPVMQRMMLSAIVFIYLSLTINGFASGGNLYSILESCALIGIVAAGLGVTMLAGEFDLSVGSVAACAGIVAVSLSGMGIVYAVVIAVAVAAVFGAVQGWAIARLQISSLVFTLGTFIGMRGLAYVLSNEKTVNLAMSDLPVSMALRERIFIFSPFSLLMIAVLIAVGLVLGYTRIGREVFALGGARKESRAAGVPQTRPLVFSFALSAGLAALAGALASLRGASATPTAYETLLLTSVAAVLIGGISVYGGRGSIFGVFVGVLTLQFLLSGLQMVGAPTWAANLTTGIVLLLFLTADIANGASPIGEALQRMRARRLHRARH